MKHIIAISGLLLSGLTTLTAEAQTESEPRFRSVAVSHPLDHDGVVLQIAESEPASEDTPPLVVLLGGSDGGIWFGRIAQDFIGRGVSTAGLSYFGHDGQSDHLVERPLEPIANALAALRSSRGAPRRCMALVGVSKGGELALVLASYQDELAAADLLPIADAYVAAVPSHVVWQAPHATLRIRSSWSLGGDPMAFVPFRWLSPNLTDVFFNRLEVGEFLSDSLSNQDAVDAAAIPVERIAQPTLLIAGRHDRMWPSLAMSQAAMDRAERLNPNTPLQLDVRELDHFVLADPEARSRAVNFVIDELRQAAEEGQCEADFG